MGLHDSFVGLGGKLNTLYDRAEDAASSDHVVARVGFHIEYQEAAFVLDQAR